MRQFRLVNVGKQNSYGFGQAFLALEKGHRMRSKNRTLKRYKK